MREKTALALCLLSCIAPWPSACTGNVGAGDYDSTLTPGTAGTDASDGAMGGRTGVGEGGAGTTAGATNGGMFADNGTEAGDSPSGTNAPVDACGKGIEPLTPGLRITQVALYQTIKIPLYAGGAWVVNRVAQVVQGKAALLRVFVQPLPDWSSHAVLYTLKVTA